MQQLDFPNYTFKLIEEDKKTKIFDAYRKQYVVLTPEEWVRQHLLHYLELEKNVPKGLIQVEKGLKLNGLSKRTDAVIYNRKGEALILIECKAPTVVITQKTFDQIARYNIKLKLPYLLVSNGLQHYFALIDFNKKSFQFIDGIPNYEDIQ